MHLAPAPNPRDLLPPLLACLPTAFISPRPPPALLPLLAPTLRQRLNFLSSSSPTSRDGWLPLLSWSQERASKLPAAVERMQIEPHPVSGEIEIDDVRPAKYRRLDDETLHARLEIEQFDLSPLYLWCEDDVHGGTGPGWKLAELRSMEDAEDNVPWFDSQSAANDARNENNDNYAASLLVPQSNGHSYHNVSHEQDADDDDDDDANDDYWAAYDRTPSRTPAQKPASAAPSNPFHTNGGRGDPSQSEERNYYARYGSEVQPALDSHDPDEEHADMVGQSTLTGDVVTRERHVQQPAESHSTSLGGGYLQALHNPSSARNDPHNSAPDTTSPEASNSNNNNDDSSGDGGEVNMPRALSPTSSHSSVEKLEERAEAISSAQSKETDRAHVGIRQHISTDIKSLFRLARSVGMERLEFERIVRTELDVLGLMERDE